MAAEKVEKSVIIGSGPAGHRAAIYLARTNLNPLFESFLANGLLGGSSPLPPMMKTRTVENFPAGIMGPELMDKFQEQLRFGTHIVTETGQEYEAPETTDAVIIATGASAKRLALPGEGTYLQSEISACAACDGAVPILRYGAQYITVLWNTVATECQGDGDLLRSLRVKNVVTGEEKHLPVNGLFYAIVPGSWCMAALEAERLLAEELGLDSSSSV
ncbi:hypothetical protein B0H10DRAFT_2174969 [Mycena sp. CBHHK59/15]|nr:hypothetical protein B0H10DRAFT_2174969 [Mycena sp. CBHHK59/15]